MTVKWTPPVSDGGAEITGYVVQQKEKLALRWTPVNEVPVTATSFKVTGLVQKNEYEFRVVAANKAGFGTPSDSSGVVLAKPPYGKTVVRVLAQDPSVIIMGLGGPLDQRLWVVLQSGYIFKNYIAGLF